MVLKLNSIQKSPKMSGKFTRKNFHEKGEMKNFQEGERYQEGEQAIRDGNWT